MDKYFNKLLTIQASNRNKVFYFHQAVYNNKDISIYFAIAKALRQVNNIINENISLQADWQFQ